ERFPLMRRYYQELLSGGLGFRLAHVEATYPNLLGLSLADDTSRPAGLDLPPEFVTPAQTPLVLNLGHADESFTVYDHPKTVLLEKVERLDATELAARLETALVPRPPGGGRRSLMMDPELAVAQRSGGTWREVFANGGPAARHPALVWLLAFEAIAFAGLPLSLRVFRPLPDRGYLLSKTLSLLLVAYLVWLGASLRLVPFSHWSVLLAAGLLAALSVLVAYRTRRELAYLLRSRWRLFLGLEVLFLLAFAGFTLLRAANPDLWHPWRGGEKPMDLAYLTAVVRSTYMPPYDPWFSGGYLNYYYFGQFLVATLVRLTGIVPEVAFNLAVPLFWALALGGAFSLVYNLTEASRNPRRLLPLSRGPLLAGLAGAALVALAGNLDGAIQVVERMRDALGPALAIGEGPWETGQALVRALTQALDWPSDGYWRASRMIAVPGSISITEFPFFTFLFADLHAHLLALPLTLLALGLAVALALSIHLGRGAPSHLLPLGLLGLVLGALFATNSWDFPTYLFVAPVGVALANLNRGTPLWRTAAWSGVTAVALLALSIFTFLPFLRSNEAFYTKIVPSPEQTPLRSYLTIFGLPLFILVSALVMALWRLATSSVSAHRGEGAAEPVAPSRLAGRRRLWGALAVALGSVALAASIAALGYSVVAFNVLLLLGLSAVIFAPGTPLPQRLGFALGGLALLLIAAVDLVAIDDHLVRMNTIFRVYLQAWVLLGLAGGYLLWWVAQEGAFRGLRRSPPKVLLATGLVLLALSAAAYPVLATKARLADRFQPLPLTLDGMAYMEKGSYGEVNGISVALAPEREALEWLRDHVDGTPVVAEAVLPPPPNDIPYYRPLSRVAVYTGLPIVMGWPWHQTQQRGIGIVEPQVQQRMNDVRELFSSPSPDRARAIMGAYGVEYVYVGQLERAYYPAEGLAKFARMPELEAAYSTQQVTIYRLRTDSRPPPARQPSAAPAMMTSRGAEGSDVSGYPLIAVIRDIVIIVWGVLGIVAFLVVILVMVALFRLLAPLLRS
ncbi:MAG: hypothetical protein HY688_02130, partial [Chloroflexi bacterium]|nr:hypothetical protein [Chloroflexota bacterium]